MKFTWDQQKFQDNLKKHGVDFRDVEPVFYDEFASYAEDLDAEGEARFVIVGEGATTDILFVVYLEYIDDEIRIISAREASLKQQRDYLARRYDI
jgi:uncharacterized DUF497 family protein